MTDRVNQSHACSMRLLGVVIGLAAVTCGVQIKPLKPALGASGARASSAAVDPRVVYRFFDEDFVAGGYAYNYPEASKVFIPEESGKNGEVAVEFDLEPGDYSGGAVCLYNMLYDLKPYMSTGALQFWIKGANGGEIAWVALVDDENSDGKKTVVRVPLASYGGIDKTWRQVTIPLADFGAKGVYWDAKKNLEIPWPFDWDKVAEFRLEIKKGDNKTFKVLADDIFIVRDVFQPRNQERAVAWEDRAESIPPVPLAKKPAVKVLRSIYKDGAPTAYVFGGKTACAVKKSVDSTNRVLCCYIDNNDYSGVTLTLGPGSDVDFTPLRAAHAAGIGFWCRANKPLKTLFLGVVDVENQETKVQSKVFLGDYGAVDTAWRYVMVPVRRFVDKGKFWDASKQAELVADMNWKKINEFRFSGNKGENAVDSGEPAALYIDDMGIIDEIPGYVDPDEYWAAFKSDKPDMVLHDFETAPDRDGWSVNKGPKSEIKVDFVPTARPECGATCMRITYKLGDYCDAMKDYVKAGTPAEKMDWSKHWGLKFDFFTDRPYQPISVQISDAGNEVFIASSGGEKGWSTVLVPFKSFTKFPYWQPPNAVQNGKLDLERVGMLDFKPAGDGSSGVFVIDNVKLTNDREVKAAAVAEKVAVRVTGDLTKPVTGKINDGIFGINAALWDGDLLKPATVDYVKAANHRVLRYPGGLRADDDHWEQVLRKKDFMVDVDEFMDFCRQTGTEPMFTVNFGKGTPEEAARWVKHVNVDRTAKVTHWEVGNEIYGDWHPNHTSAPDYGRRCAEFIRAMKAVDPSIKVGVVWVLDGAWNREVFDSTKGLADAVIIHHYSQHTGEENDPGLLAAPQGLERIIAGVRKQTADFGVPGKNYEVWLTEWNSVDLKPGPQALSIVNGLFAADYLGMLAKVNIEQASYWDIHNDMTEQGGDYGYLSRTGAPDGDNVPRPSYWAFRLAGECLRGTLCAASASDDHISVYLAQDGKRRALLLINKYPRTSAEVTIAVAGFAGVAVLKQLTKKTTAAGPAPRPLSVGPGQAIVLPPYSVTAVEMQ